MLRLLFLLFFQGAVMCMAQTRPFTVDDLLAISSLSPKNLESYMNKNGFSSGGRNLKKNVMAVTFHEKMNINTNDTLAINRSIDIYKTDDTYCFALHTSSQQEYQDGQISLIKQGFVYDDKKKQAQASSQLFQKGNITVLASVDIEYDGTVYTFLLGRKEFPSAAKIQFADDLLNFDSHEYLVSYFGEKNVKKDLYYFTEKDLKNCSVLFGNSGRQVVFVWADEANMRTLSYILICGIMPTVSAAQFEGHTIANEWRLKNGLRCGMSLKELILLNGKDFEFYGDRSDFPLMVDPEKSGEIDFKKTGIMLNCLACNGSALMNRTKVSAEDAVENSLPLYVFNIMISR
jgi:hypothetical protein